MKKKSKKCKINRMVVVIGLFVCNVSFIILNHYGSSDSRSKYPKYEPVDLESVTDVEKMYYEGLLKSQEKDIFLQTGLGKAGIDSLREESVNFEDFFDSLRVYQHQLFLGADNKQLVELKTGDVLVSMSQRFCFYTHGHAALVVDGEKNILLEARSYRAGSCFCRKDKWEKLSSIVVLRLKPEVKESFEKENGYDPAQNAAKYAMENLNGLKYSLFKDLRPLSKTTPKYTQCAQLVWYAYYVGGLDIDENRGLIIKPKDFLQSEVFDVVQAVGISPADILKMRRE